MDYHLIIMDYHRIIWWTCVGLALDYEQIHQQIVLMIIQLLLIGYLSDYWLIIWAILKNWQKVGSLNDYSIFIPWLLIEYWLIIWTSPTKIIKGWILDLTTDFRKWGLVMLAFVEDNPEFAWIVVDYHRIIGLTPNNLRIGWYSSNSHQLPIVCWSSEKNPT